MIFQINFGMGFNIIKVIKGVKARDSNFIHGLL